MSQEEQGRKASEVTSDAAVKEVIPAKPTELSDEALDKVAGGQVQVVLSQPSPAQKIYTTVSGNTQAASASAS